MSPHQHRILAVLASRSPDSISGPDLRDIVSPDASVKCLHVQVHYMRRKGIPIESSVGRGGGFRIRRASCTQYLRNLLNVLPLPEVKALTGKSYATLARLAEAVE